MRLQSFSSSAGVSVSRLLLAGPGERSLATGEGTVPAHRLLQAGLLLGLEKGVILEGILRRVALERHRVREVGVPLLQLEVILDDFREHRRCLNRHTCFSS